MYSGTTIFNEKSEPGPGRYNIREGFHCSIEAICKSMVYSSGTLSLSRLYFIVISFV